MAPAFSSALSRLQNSGDLLHLSCSDQLRGPGRSTRVRQLPPDRTLQLFVQQIAHGNIACSAVRHLAGQDFTDSAWCQARARLPIEDVEQTNTRLVESTNRELDLQLGDDSCTTRRDADHAPTSRWRGHRVFMLDGTSDTMPDTPALRDHYGVPGNALAGLGFPTSHLLIRTDHRTGLIHDCIDGPLYRSDLADTPAIIDRLQPDDVVLADIAFSGYATIALILRHKAHVVMPVHHRRIIDFAPARDHAHPRKGKSTKRAGKPRSRVIERIGHDDQIVEYFKPTDKPAWMSDDDWRQTPETIRLREIRRTFHRRGFKPIVVTIVTTLLDHEAYPAEALIELRLTRWMIETSFRHLKTTLGMDELKCKTIDGVRKERMIFILVYNLIRVLMIHAATKQNVNVHRISFADTLAWLRHARHDAPRGTGVRSFPKLIVNPIRIGRLEPRVLKRAKKQFPHMTQTRAELKAQLRARHGVAT